MTENLLHQFPKIDAVVADSDNMALAALEAFAAAGRPKPLVVSMDGTVEGVSSVAAGGLFAVSEFSGFLMGCVGVEMLEKLSKGEKVPERITLNAALITMENASQFMVPIDKRKCKSIVELGF